MANSHTKILDMGEKVQACGKESFKKRVRVLPYHIYIYMTIYIFFIHTVYGENQKMKKIVLCHSSGMTYHIQYILL